MPLWLEFWDRPFLPESVSDKIRQNHGQSYTIIDSSQRVCFRPPNRDLKWSIYRVKSTADCPPPACTFLRRFFAYFPIGNYRFSYHSNVLLVFRENNQKSGTFWHSGRGRGFYGGYSSFVYVISGTFFDYILKSRGSFLALAWPPYFPKNRFFENAEKSLGFVHFFIRNFSKNLIWEFFSNLVHFD